MSSSDESVTIYPVRIKDKGSVYNRRLVDVRGRTLTAPDGSNLNLFSGAMRDAFMSGTLRCVHVLYPGYRYFVTDDDDQDEFVWDRENGSERPHATYHAYFDEDFDWDYTDHPFAIYIPKRQ